LARDVGSGLVRLLRVRVFVSVGVGQVLEFEAVELVEAVGGVGLAVGVGRGRAGERAPGVLFTARRQQGIRVGVEQPGGPWAQPTTGQLGYLQGHYRRVGEALIPADAGFDDPQLDQGGAFERTEIRLADERERPVQAAKGTFAVGHDRQVVVISGQPAGRTEFRQRLGPAAGAVRRDAARRADDAYPGRQPMGHLRVGVPLLRIFGQSGRY
jgi:hypothetical protein